MAGTTHSPGPLCMHEREQKQRKRNSACKGNLYSSSLCNYFIFMSMQIQFIKQFFKFYIQIIQASFSLPHLILNYSKGLNVAMLADQLINLKCFVGARFSINGLKYTKKVIIMSRQPYGKIDLFVFVQISLPFCRNLPSSRYQKGVHVTIVMTFTESRCVGGVRTSFSVNLSSRLQPVVFSWCQAHVNSKIIDKILKRQA